MKLPRFDSGEVQSLGQYNLGAELQASKAAGDLATQVSETAGQMIDYHRNIKDQRQATEIASQNLSESRKLNDFLKNEFINLDDEFIPDEIRQEVQDDPMFAIGDTSLSQTGGLQVPTHVVADKLINYYQGRIAEREGTLQGYRQGMFYRDMASETLNKNLTESFASYETHLINGTRRNYEKEMMSAANEGNIALAKNLSDRMWKLNLIDEEAKIKNDGEIVKIAFDRASFQKDQYLNSIANAVRQGDKASLDLTLQNYYNDLRMHEAFGVIDRGTFNEWSVAADKVIQMEESRAVAIDVWAKDGIASGIATTEGLLKAIPEYFDPESGEWDAFVNGVRSELWRMEDDRKKIIESGKEIFDSMVMTSKVQQALNNPNVVLPQTTDNVNLVSDYYDLYKAQWQAGGPENFINRSVEFTKAVGIIPKALMLDMSAAVNTGDPASMEWAVEMFSRLRFESPQLLGQLTGDHLKTHAFLERVTNIAEITEDYQKAFNLAWETTYQVPVGIQSDRKQEYAGMSKSIDKRVNASMENNPDWNKWIDWFDPEITARYKEEYRILEQNAYILTGDIEQAQAIAERQMQSTWGIDETSGTKRMMKFGPISMYGEYANSQFENMVKNNFPELYEKYGVGAFELEANEVTSRRDKPAYNIKFINPDSPLDRYYLIDQETGVPFYWRPDFTQTDEYKFQQIEEQIMLENYELMQTIYDQAFTAFTESEKSPLYPENSLQNMMGYSPNEMRERSIDEMFEQLIEQHDLKYYQRPYGVGAGTPEAEKKHEELRKIYKIAKQKVKDAYAEANRLKLKQEKMRQSEIDKMRQEKETGARPKPGSSSGWDGSPL